MIESKNRVLLIDDDMALGQMYVMGLRHLGFEVYYLPSFVAITSVINEFQPNIVVLDIELGTKNGLDESNTIFRCFPELPIVFISSHEDNDYIIRAYNQGGAYLKKPFTIESLEAYIDRFAKNIQPAINFGDFSYEIESNTLCNIRTNTTNKLSSKEAEVLALLIKSVNTTLPRGVIEQHLGDCATTEFILNNIISRLRKIIGDDSQVKIITKSKVGYMLTDH